MTDDETSSHCQYNVDYDIEYLKKTTKSYIQKLLQVLHILRFYETVLWEILWNQEPG